MSLNTLRTSGKEAAKSLNKAMQSLQAFNRFQGAMNILGKTTGAMLFGGAAGATGGKMLQKATGEK
jgi:hypothetical protein